MESFYYTRDHLGSIRELTDANGDVRARYDYDVWGNAVVLEGDMSLDFGYTGHYFHAASGLNLTLYRAYSPALGRWLNRDPIAERGGLNLYAYTLNNPINGVDPLGMDTYWHDAQDTVAGFIHGFIPILPYDATNDAMRYGNYIGTATSLALVVEGVVSGIARCAARTGLTTGADEAVFWSGIGRNGGEGAASWAAHNGGATLEATRASRGLTLPAWNASNPATVAAWRQASIDFAAGARGNVRVLQGDALRVDAIWRSEFGALQANPNVNSIRAINPNSGAEVLLWSR